MRRRSANAMMQASTKPSAPSAYWSISSQQRSRSARARCIPQQRLNAGVDDLGPLLFVDTHHAWVDLQPDHLFRKVDGSDHWGEVTLCEAGLADTPSRQGESDRA